MITKPELPSLIGDLSEFDKDLVQKLTKIFEEYASEINDKQGSEYENVMYWMTRP